MADQYLRWEIGSNLSPNFGIPLDEFRKKITDFAGYVTGMALRQSMYAAANIFRDAIESATPIGRTGTDTRKKHKVGQARASVIVYERQRRSLFTSADELSLLVGYEKKQAYYMYWYEYGRKEFELKAKKAKSLHWIGTAGEDRFAKRVMVGMQPARQFMRSACDAAEPIAWDAAMGILGKVPEKFVA